METKDDQFPPLVQAGATAMDALVQDYSLATVTVVYQRLRKTNHRELLFALVELWTRWHEIPSNQEEALSPRNRPELNLRRWALDIPSSVTWYRALASGVSAVPPSKHNRAGGPLEVHSDPLADEPTWPSFTAVSPMTAATPWRDRPGGVRVHHQLRASMEPSMRSWSDEERGWIEKELGFPLLERPNLVGSAHLVLANPIFFGFERRLIGGSGRELAIRFHPYPGQDLSSLRLHVREHRPDGATVIAALPVENDRFILELPNPPDQDALDVVCSRRGVLFHSPLSGYLTSIQLRMNLTEATRRFSVERRNGRADEFSVSVVPASQVITIGEALPRPALARLAQDQTDAGLLSTPEPSDDQRWFSDEPKAAADFIRKLIGTASERVLMVDPYFDGECLLRFALANATADVEVRVLTSKMGLLSGARSPISPDQCDQCHQPLPSANRPYASILEALAKDLKKVRETTTEKHPDNGVTIRVMGGKKAPVHDRFLACDDRLWLIGSSLNELGDRGTLVVRVPRPNEILLRLEEEWSKAPSLEDALDQTRRTVEEAK